MICCHKHWFLNCCILLHTDLVGRDQLPQQSTNAFGKGLNVMDICLNAKSPALQVYHKFGVVLGPAVIVFLSSVFVCLAAKCSPVFGQTLTVSVCLVFLGRCGYICFSQNHRFNRKRMAQSEPKQWSCMLENQNSEIKGEIHWFQFCSQVEWITPPYLKESCVKPLWLQLEQFNTSAQVMSLESALVGI